MRVCVITDNAFIYEGFTNLLKRNPQNAAFDFFYTPWNRTFAEKYGKGGEIHPILLKEQEDSFFKTYDLYFSLHCKQLFPQKMVTEHICINVHPGYNPYNRGWFPQVFGIMNKLPVGVTIHRMDEELDHGPVLYQQKLALHGEETSKDIYNRILDLEMELLEEHLTDILTGNYTLTPMAEEGNVNSKQDFDALCAIPLDKPATYGEVIDYLRAMTFAPYQNAYFIDADGKKVYVGITLRKEE